MRGVQPHAEAEDVPPGLRELLAMAKGEWSDPDRKPERPELYRCDVECCESPSIEFRWGEELGWVPVCAEHRADVEVPAENDLFVEVRDFAANAARSVAMVDPLYIDTAIRAGERALALGPVLDPSLFLEGALELEQQLKVMRALREFRNAIEELRPATRDSGVQS